MTGIHSKNGCSLRIFEDYDAKEEKCTMRKWQGFFCYDNTVEKLEKKRQIMR